MDDADDDDITPGDGTRANPPTRFASLRLHPRCLIDEPTHRARNAFHKFLDVDCVVSWGLVPSHDLAAPFAVTGPVDANEGRSVLADWSSGARAVQRHVVARPGADDRQAEGDTVV